MTGDETSSTFFSPDELARYERQIRLPVVGAEGQSRLRAGSVLVVGAGGLGSAALLYLAAAGVGRLGVVDSDRVEAGNLHRQVIHETASIGAPKTDSTVRRLQALNPHCMVEPFPARFEAPHAENIAAGYDILLDATDNLETRFLINAVCVRRRKPMVYGSAMRLEGQAGVFDARHGACYRCMVPSIPAAGSMPSPAEAGVLGPLPGVIGSLQAVLALRLLLGLSGAESGRVVLFDGLRAAFEEVVVPKRKNCPGCG